MAKDYPNLKIRNMKHSDIPAMVHIISTDLSPIDGKKAHKDLTDQSRKLYDDGQVFVAESEGKLLGLIGYWRMHYHPKTVCWMDWFGVEKNHRRTGIGSALLLYMLPVLAKKRYRMLCCEKSSKDIAAKLFYERYGFKEAGRIKKYWEDGGDWVVLVKKL
ncbi:MAG TPA: GNAT family N-acetyltransferase [Nanoarchaeota archaeon]|nr:GNAT family N-acetyltransferase [Nanoarchaeota archaeon]